jgi:hypothetical protein
MIAVEFDARVTNGQIEIPAVHQASVQGEVHVIVFPQSKSAGTTIIQELLKHPLHVPQFQPLTRDQAHERE